MAVSLTWIRDHYDAKKDRYIDEDERNVAAGDWSNGLITTEQLQAVIGAYSLHILLPEYGTTQTPTTVTPTVHVTSLIIKSGSVLKVDGVEVI